MIMFDNLLLCNINMINNFYILRNKILIKRIFYENNNECRDKTRL